MEELLEQRSVARTGLFEPAAVAGLVRRCRAGTPMGFRESQALVAILSTELWHRQFITSDARGSARPAPHDNRVAAVG